MNQATQDNQEIAEAYATLDLTPGARLPQVKAAFRRLALALHPDHNPGAAGTLMARINRAYAILSAHLSDQPVSVPPVATPAPLRPYVFESFDSPSRARSNPVPRARAAQTPSEASPLADFIRFNELDHPWATPAFSQSSPAGSSGWRLVGLRRQGEGVLYQVEISGRPQSLTLPIPSQESCRACGGSGLLGQGTCPACGGRGHLTRPRQVRLDLPPVWVTGQRLALGAAPGREPLEVELRTAPRVRF